MDDSAQMAAELRDVGLEAGLDALGFADAVPFLDARSVIEERKAAGLHAGMQFTYRNPARSTDPSRALAGARSLVVGARRYVRQFPGTSPDAGISAGPAGRIARYSWVDHYMPLRAALEVVARCLRDKGFAALVVADDNALVDRAAAHRAGLGWYGRNTTILLPGAGSWFVLGTVVTDALLPAGATPIGDGCGSCRRCSAACPTGALDVPGTLDARRCLAWLVQAPGVFPIEHRVALGDRIYGCDDCQEVCPVNRLAERRHPLEPAEPGARASVDALAILAADDAALLESWGRWYIPARDPTYLRRNALLVIGNAGNPESGAIKSAVSAALRHPQPLVRAHAVWAARRLGLDGLLAIVEDDADPRVLAEMDPACSVPRRVTRPARDASAVTG